MAWTIHSWSAETGTGAIKSPHFGPVQFDASANVDHVNDFCEGEPVLVELDGHAPTFRVRLIRPMVQRQPLGTHWAPFDAINGRFGDASIEDQTPTSLQIWLGNCCDHCTPNPARVRFDGVTHVEGLGDDVDFCCPLFRLASTAEIHASHVAVPTDSTAFCVVSSHGQGPDGPSILVVAQTARVLD